MTTRDELLYLARIQEQTDRYDEMTTTLAKIVDFEE